MITKQLQLTLGLLSFTLCLILVRSVPGFALGGAQEPHSPAAVDPLLAVHKIYVMALGDKLDAVALRRKLQERLRHTPGLTLVDKPEEADAMVTGKGEIYIKGHYSLNPRAHSVEQGTPVYGGYLSVELKNSAGDTIWSYLAAPRSLGPPEIADNLSSQVANKLADEINKTRAREKAAK